jgi:hypothetical protein
MALVNETHRAERQFRVIIKQNEFAKMLISYAYANNNNNNNNNGFTI